MAMRSSRCAFSTAAALHRIFIAPIEHSCPRVPQQTYYARAHKGHFEPIQRRSYASLPLAKQRLPDRLPRDDEIVDKQIYIVSDDNKLSPLQYTSSVLHSIDRKSQSLIMVARSGPKSETSDEPGYPICKIQSKKKLHEVEKAKSKKKDNPSATLKTMELNWAIDPHDLKHRLERVKNFLSKGWRVDIVMAGKKKGRKATPEEASTLVAKVREAIAGVEGAKEWKMMDGKVGAMATIYVEGKQGLK